LDPNAHLLSEKIKSNCLQIDDEMRWLIALISDSGMCLADAAGLLKTDLVLKDDYPLVDLKQHNWRLTLCSPKILQ
jgi:hypothetical protein